MNPVAVLHKVAKWRPLKSIRPLPLGCVFALVFLVFWWGRSSDQATGKNTRSPSVRALDLSGRPVDPFEGTEVKLMVFVFVSVDCPISNRYAPEVQRLATEFAPRGVAFRLVYPNADETAEVIRKHLKDHGYTLEALRDPRHELTKATGVRVTPEASVFAPGRGFVYLGRIDDRVVGFGQTRAAPTQHDLKDAVTAILDGKPVPRTIARAVGCYISEAP